VSASADDEPCPYQILLSTIHENGTRHVSDHPVAGYGTRRRLGRSRGTPRRRWRRTRRPWRSSRPRADSRTRWHPALRRKPPWCGLCVPVAPRPGRRV